MTMGAGKAQLFSGQSPPVPQVPAPTFPLNGVFVQNTNPYAVQVNMSLSGVTFTHVYINVTNSVTGASDLATVMVAGAGNYFMLPSGWWFRLDYSAGTPVWVWTGGF